MSKMIFKAPNLLDNDFLQHRNLKFIKSPHIPSVQVDKWELTLKQTVLFLIWGHFPTLCQWRVNRVWTSPNYVEICTGMLLGRSPPLTLTVLHVFSPSVFLTQPHSVCLQIHDVISFTFKCIQLYSCFCTDWWMSPLEMCSFQSVKLNHWYCTQFS